MIEELLFCGFCDSFYVSVYLDKEIYEHELKPCLNGFILSFEKDLTFLNVKIQLLFIYNYLTIQILPGSKIAVQ